MLTLVKAVQATDGDVCEVGVGLSSTPLLHWFTLGRRLISYENDPGYLHFARNFQSNNHRIRHLDELDYDKHWSVVFIDHSPKKPKTRGDDAMKFTNADLIVLHDTEPNSLEHYGYQQVFDKYKYHYHWQECKPFTSIVSNTIDVTKWSA
jgi:hypothetical protein